MTISRIFSASLYALSRLAAQAGLLILDTAGQKNPILKKADGTPVSKADMHAHHSILKHLKMLFPDWIVISEEMDSSEWPCSFTAPFFSIDPLDGTREFLAGRTDYTVNIALIAEQKPVLGIIHAPALGLTYAGAKDLGAWRAKSPVGLIPSPEDFTPIQARSLATVTNRVAYASRSHRDPHTEAFLKEALQGKTSAMPQIHKIEILGSSLKFACLAEGKGDFYPRFSPTREWDIAAGHALLDAAGGTLFSPDGTPLRYGKTAEKFINGNFIARGSH